MMMIDLLSTSQLVHNITCAELVSELKQVLLAWSHHHTIELSYKYIQLSIMVRSHGGIRFRNNLWIGLYCHFLQF
jgi:hypothetical protein